MRRVIPFPALMVGALLSLGLGSTAVCADEDVVRSGNEAEVTVVLERAGDAEGEHANTWTVEVDGVKPSSYWIGVHCSPLDDDLIAHQLGVRSGLVIQQVVDDSPADKAGLKEHDILVSVGGKPVESLKVLVTAIEKAKGEALKLTVVRKGKRQAVTVSPEKRPANVELGLADQDPETRQEWATLLEALRKHGDLPALDAADEGEPGHPGAKMFYVRPGFILPDKLKDFPENLEVSINKKGDEPAKITVRRGEDKWEVDENSIDKLPKDIRAHVEHMAKGGLHVEMHGDGAAFEWQGTPLVAPKLNLNELREKLKKLPRQNFQWRGVGPDVAERVREQAQKQLDQARRQLDRVREQVPAESIEKIQTELKQLRAELEQLRADKAKTKPEKKPGKKPAKKPAKKTGR